MKGSDAQTSKKSNGVLASTGAHTLGLGILVVATVVLGGLMLILRRRKDLN